MAFRSSALTNSLIADMPAGVVAGDRLLALVACDGSGSNGAPAGWEATQLVELILILDGHTVRVFEKRNASGSEGATQTFTGGGTGEQVIILAFSGRDNSAAVSFITGTQESGSGTTTPLSISGASGTCAAGDDVAAFIALDPNSGTDVWSFSAWSSSLTEREDGVNGSWCVSGAATVDNVSGAFGTVTATGTRTAGSGAATWGLVVISIPAAAGAVEGNKSSVAQNAYTGLGI